MSTLTGKYISQSYGGLIKFDTNTGIQNNTYTQLEDGLGTPLNLRVTNQGYISASKLVTSDITTQDLIVSGNLYAKYIYAEYTTASFVVSTGSNTFGDQLSDVQIMSGTIGLWGTVNVPADTKVTMPNLTGSLFGTARSASVAESASISATALSASYVQTAQTASYVLSASFAGKSSQADTSSFATAALSSSYAFTANHAYTASNAITADLANSASFSTFATTSSFVVSASVANLANTASYAYGANNALSASVSDKLGDFGTGDYVKNTSDTYTGTAKILQVITCTQAEYNALTPDNSTVYFIF